MAEFEGVPLCYCYAKNLADEGNPADRMLSEHCLNRLRLLNREIDFQTALVVVYGDKPKYEDANTLICKIVAKYTEKEKEHEIEKVALVVLHYSPEYEKWEVYASTNFHTLIPIYSLAEPPLILLKQKDTEYYKPVR